MNKEKVRELSEFVIGHQATKITIESLITQWIEQNHPEPVVVGLSDEQIISLNGKLHEAQERHNDFGILDIKQWLENQAFERPKPTQWVEVGQVWVCTANKKHYLIKRIETLEGEVKINNGKWEKDLVLVTYWHKETAESPREYSRTLSDFLAKFERVI